MALAAGTRLGPYEVVAALGAGGMGEVYQARDTRLDRTVAIKVLPPELSTDPERRARFEREARTIAALNHPHICTLHDIGQHDGATYLVMEHLAGETLAQRLRRGPLPVPQALEIGAQIADALDAAHKQGIVHRDLKPSNVMLTTSGTGRSGIASVKLLDFGLAKLRESCVPAASSESTLTVTEPLTQAGEVLGTRPYMAPEQVEGKATDARTDLWALGCVLYEMVTGRPAFTGDSVASITAAILEREPEPLGARQPLAPHALQHLVATCLAKDPDARWQAASDVARQLRWIGDECRLAGSPGGEGPSQGLTADTTTAGRRRHTRRLIAAAAAVAGVSALSVAITWLFVDRRPAVDLEVRHLLLDARPAQHLGSHSLFPRVDLNRPTTSVLALTPDGRRLVFAGLDASGVRLFVRDLREGEARPIPNTDGAEAVFLSPDGRSVGFWVYSGSTYRLKRVAVDGGGVPLDVCQIADGPLGTSWGDDDRIVFSARVDSGLYRVPSDGGAPEVLTRPEPGEFGHRLPHVLPGSQAVMFTVVEQSWNWETARVVVHRFGTPGWKEVVRGAADARYLPTGHLVYFRRGRLMAAPFDLERLEKTGPEVGLVADVMQGTNGVNQGTDSGAAQAAFSAAGTLAYVAGGEVPDVNKRLVWIDRQGQVEPLAVPLKPYYVPRISPDGQRIAVHTLQSERRVWTHDLRIANSLTPVTPPEIAAMQPAWTRDGERLAFLAFPSGRPGLYWARADGTQPPERLGGGFVVPVFWTPEGSLVYSSVSKEGDRGVWLLSPQGGAWNARALVDSPAWEVDGQVSPDGRWLAYSSDESGRFEVYVQRLPDLTERRPVSADGGRSPVWARDGRELFYVRGSGPGSELVALDVREGGAIAPRGRPLFRLADIRATNYFPVPGFDVSPDGRRFVFTQYSDTPVPEAPNEIHLVLNWVEELKAKVPSGTR